VTIIKAASVAVVSLGIPVLAMVEPSEQLSAQTAQPEPARVEISALAPDPPKDPRVAAFAAAIQRLSDDADGVDRLWQAYRSQCVERRDGPTYDGFGREWFGILDAPGNHPADSECGEMRHFIRRTGGSVREDVRRAVAAARAANLDRGTEVGMLRWNSLELQ
jgi:hypothetical protein